MSRAERIRSLRDHLSAAAGLIDDLRNDGVRLDHDAETGLYKLLHDVTALYGRLA